MNATELEIYEKYPKVWNRLVDFANQNDKFTHELCYCAIEKFFEDNGIIINISWCLSAQRIKSGRYELYDLNMQRLYNATFVGANKDFAKYEAILKACEILEDKLNGERDK